ncbi:MAG: phosphoenolpyruvate synthase [Candidatus Diapherotrites archaeon]
MQSPSIVWFRDIQPSDLNLVGGKGLNLGIMYKANFPIPPGFVVSATAYFNFVKSTGIQKKILDTIDFVDVENTEQLQQASQEVRELILSTPMSKELEQEIKRAYLKLGERQLLNLSTVEEDYVAVRSSATAEDLAEASFAGAQETFLNVKGVEEVLSAVKKCWASLFTSRAVYYRKKNKFMTARVGLAAVIQKMVQSDVAGVMFTADPSNGDVGKIVIEGAYGLGEAVVSGALTPDTYTLEKGSLQILDKKIATQSWKFVRGAQGNSKAEVQGKAQSAQKLSDSFIVQFAKIGKQIESQYGKPQDIEWALENGKLYIVQTRAITTMKKVQDAEEKPRAEEKRESFLQGIAASPGIATGRARVIPSAQDIGKVQEGDILVTKMTNPDWVPAMQKVIAIVTDEGGKTSHAAIVSRELGIPAIVGTEQATKKIVDGEVITVDGFSGKIFKGKVVVEPVRVEVVQKGKLEAEEKEVEILVEEAKAEEKQLEIAAHAPKVEPQTAKVFEAQAEKLEELLKIPIVKVKVNVALPEAAEKAAQSGAAGVGLLRAEHMMAESAIHPAQMMRDGKREELKEQLKTGIRKVAIPFVGKPVWYRNLDIRTDEFRNLQGGELEPKEENPMMGWHGIRRSLDEPELLKVEFEAIKELREEGVTNVGVMIPFVQHVNEFKKAKEIAIEVGLKPHEDVPFGIMVETPAAVWTIQDFLEEGIDFVSFGTNDLTQLTLGVDRNNEKLQKLFSELHPAILSQIAFVLFYCKKAGVECSICGQAGSNPEMVKKLVRMGISSISANIDAVEQIKQVVLEEEKKRLMDALNKK